jgi:hypothetical protein
MADYHNFSGGQDGAVVSKGQEALRAICRSRKFDEVARRCLIQHNRCGLFP